ncbi:hypothetical protein KR009_011738, partial [Drosophila setifemur]
AGIAMNSNAMRVLSSFPIVLILCGLALSAPAGEDDLNQSTPFNKAVIQQSKAAEMESFMDRSVDPCTDFYSFACGNYERINSAQTLQVLTTGIFESLTKGLNRKILKMLHATNDPHDTPEDRQVKHFYESCLGIEELSSVYNKKMKQLIAEFGAMPVLEGRAWREEDFDWQATTARMSHRYGISPILGAEVSKDFANIDINRVYVGQQDFPLESRSMYMDNETLIYREKFQANMQRTLQRFLGVPKELAKSTSKELIDFEADLARGLTDESEGLDIKDMAELMTLPEIQKRYAPTLNITRIVHITMGEPISDKIYEFNSRYQRNLVEVIQRTPLRTVANYMFFRLVWEFAVTPQSTLQKQKDACVGLTKKIFAKNLDNMFYRRYNTDKSSSEIESMWRQLKSAFNDALRSSPVLNWIARPTRNLAIAKLEAMTLQVNNYANQNFTEEFKGLNLQSSDYVENFRQTCMLGARQMRESLHEPATELDAGETLSYTPANILIENTIKVPVSLLQPFYIWADVYPNAVMFGTLAALIGHELIHGFDDSGRGFDARGNSHDWWDEESSNNFQERRQCFTRQYGRYVYDGIKLKESISQAENIADNGGVRLAYAAYRMWYERQLRGFEISKDLAKERLASLDFTGKQLFFLSFAQIWCNTAHPNVKALQVSTDQHMPGKFRVIGSLSNFDEFSKEFNCPAGSPMNPSEKCVLY